MDGVSTNFYDKNIRCKMDCFSDNITVYNCYYLLITQN